jgi:hypothetical protein
MRGALHATFAALAVVLASGVAAQPDLRRGVEQKIDFVGTLVTRSPLAARINASANEQAREFLKQSVEHHQMAITALKVGDLEGAEREANQAILAVGRARQLVPDDMRRVLEQRMRYHELTSAVEMLVASHERHRAAAGRPVDPEWTETLRMLDRARTLYASERLGEATGALSDVQQRLLRQMSGLLTSNTIDYTMRFTGPAQEFEYEMKRYRSLEDLVPAALKEFNPKADARAAVDRHLESSRRMARTAQQQASAGSADTAVTSIREAVAEVQRALTATGLAIPQ